MVASQLDRIRPAPTLGVRDLARLTVSAAASDSGLMPTGDFPAWFADRVRLNSFEVTRIPFASCARWGFDQDTGNFRHDSGRFFTIEGLRVSTDYGSVSNWDQPVINQPEIGILGILVREFGGVLHCLMQAKMEPGNVNLLQLSPTVQATRSNYTRVHAGASVPYLDYFTPQRRGRVLVDVLQSEHGAWYHCKRNRNMIVEVDEEIPLHDDYCWLTVGQLRQLLHQDNVVNMDARTVLACMPFGPGMLDGAERSADAGFRSVLAGALEPGGAGALDRLAETLHWLTEAKSTRDVSARIVGLDDVARWRVTDDEIAHEDGKHFKVIAVSARASSREVTSWCQPLVQPIGEGLIVLLTRQVTGTVEVLLHARVEAGYRDVVEFAPTVQSTPLTFRGTPPDDRPAYLDYVATVPPERIQYDVMHCEEGGRTYRARNRYMVIEVEPEFPTQAPPGYFWVEAGRMQDLVAMPYCLNVQARTLLACIKAI